MYFLYNKTMNVEIASQLESPLVQSLQSALISKPFNYGLNKNYPILSKQSYSVSADTIPGTSTNGLNTTLNFKVPRYGLLYGMAIKSVINTSATKTATLTRLSTLGARIFSNVSLRSHSRVIQDNSSNYILSRMLEASQEQYNAYVNMTTGVPAVDNNVTSISIYTPLFFFFGEKTGNFLDTTFVENLEVVATTNSLSGVWGQNELLSTFGFSSCTLECYYVQLENGVHQSLIASQFPMGKSLTMLANDCYVESPTTATYSSGSTLSISHEVKSKNVAMSCYVYARDRNTNALLPINSLTITANGQTIVSSDRRTQIFENSSNNKFLFNVPGSSTGSDAYFVYFGLDMDKTYVSGVNALQSLNSPTITAVVDTSSGVTGSDVIELSVVFDYFTLLSISSDSGQVQRSLTN